MSSRKSLFPDSSSDLLHSDSSLSFLFGNKREESNQEQEQSLNTILGVGGLRQEKFRREQKLYKLLQKLGNLSTIEIDQELNQVDDKLNKNIDKIIHDMIQVAIDDEIVPPRSKENPKEDSQVKKKKKKKRLNPQRNNNQINNHSIEELVFTKTDTSPEFSIPKAPVELQNFRSQSLLQHPGSEKKSNSFRFPLLYKMKNHHSLSLSLSLASASASASESSSPLPHGQQQHPEPSYESSAILINNHNSHSKLHLIDQLKQISQIHDSTNLYIEKEWENLINDINRQFYTNHYQNNEPKQKQTKKDNDDDRELYWRFGIRGSNLLQLKNNQQFYYPFINLINQYGIPNKYRRILWLELSGANNIRINGEYQELLLNNKTSSGSDGDNKMDALIKSNIEQIELDLHRTLPSNFYFNNFLELKPGIKFYKLKRILYTFVKRNPHIGYVQGMNKIVGTLLLLEDNDNNNNGNSEDDNEEDTFWLFIAIVEEILPKYSPPNDKNFFNSIDEIYQDNLKLKNLLSSSSSLPNLSNHLNKFNVEIEILLMNWWLTLFIDLKFIELDTWFKIFDNLLITNVDDIGDEEDGIDDNSNNYHHRRRIILPAMTLAILKNLENYLINLNSRDLIYQFLNHGDDKFKIKFSDLMKHYNYFLKRKEVIDAFR
ncbi:Rab-GTPase-TBC domain family protein [Candida albicans]|uniref:Oxidant-induced cell-cycle arrest protein 5 n=1 Tax=Candida albicans TaxID=5476 RepID=A0A8H6C4J0_CANAX|nr:Rab-GTPase-TBC domain family protein [Candida albicans]